MLTHITRCAASWCRLLVALVATSLLAARAEADTLTPSWLVAEVLARNATIAVARQAAAEAATRPDQLTILADPILSYETAPGTIGSDYGQGQRIRLSQRLEWPGKVAARVAVAGAEADAHADELTAVQQRLATMAKLLFLDLYSVACALRINDEQSKLMAATRHSTDVTYISGRGRQADALEATLEQALIARERLRLIARQASVEAEINGLLHRPATDPLAPPPETLVAAVIPSGSASAWLERALKARPELKRLAHQIEAGQSGVSASRREAFPDLGLAVSYNNMWSNPAHRLMLGASVSIPLSFGARRASVVGANASLAGAVAAQHAQEDAVGTELRIAWASLVSAVAEVALYEAEILPAARRIQAAADAAYQSGRGSFSALMAASHRQWRLELEYIHVVTDTWRHHAEFMQAVGEPEAVLAAGGVQ